MRATSTFDRSYVIAALTLGSIGTLMIGLQPLLLGELLAAGRLSMEGVGIVAMGEIVSLGLGVVLGDILQSRVRFRSLMVVAALVAVCMDVATLRAMSDASLIAVRTLAGFAQGMLVWGGVSLLLRVAEPDRLSGLFMLLQTLAQAAIAALLAFTVLPRFGISGGFLLLALLTLFVLVLVRWQPDRLPPILDHGRDNGFVWSMGHVLLLLVVFGQLCAIGALWAYMEPLGKSVGLDGQGAQWLIAGTLFMQVLGGAFGTFLVRRIPELSMLAMAALSLAGVGLGMYVSIQSCTFGFLLLCGLFGFVWLSLTPFQIRLALRLDPTGRVAILVPAMQLLGSACGPLVASQWVVGEQADMVTLVSAGFSLVVVGLVASIRRYVTAEPSAFENQVVLIVGASSGIGRCLALRLAAQGAVVVATARSLDRLNDLQREIIDSGGRCLIHAADALDETMANRVVEDVVANLGRIDVVVLNAGGAPALDMRRMSASQVTQCMRANYDVVVNYLFPVLRHMRNQGAGLVVHTNSLASFLGVPLQGPYCAAKGAMRLLMDTCRIEFGADGIRFLSIYPGFVATAKTTNDGMPAPLEISEDQAVSYMILALRGGGWDYLFPLSLRWLVRLARVLPKPLLAAILRRELPPDTNGPASLLTDYPSLPGERK